MTITRNIKADADRITIDCIRAKMPSPKILIAEVCWDLNNQGFIDSYSDHQIASGLEKEFISKIEMSVCKKMDATNCLRVGIKDENGMFTVGQFKTFWLKHKTS